MNPRDDESDALEYDTHARQLITTNYIGQGAFGASEVVASNVPPWFGMWAVTVWRRGVITGSDVGDIYRAVTRERDREP